MDNAVPHGRSIAVRDSLRWRVPSLISALLLIVVVTVVWAAHRTVEETLLRAGGERAQAAADQVAAVLDGQGTVERLRALGGDQALRQFLTSRTASTRDAALARLKALAGTTGLRRIELWDAGGALLLEFSIPGTAGPDADPRELPRGSFPTGPGIGPLQALGDIVYSDVIAEIVGQAVGEDDAPTAPAGRLGYVVTRLTFVENPRGIFSRLVGPGAAVRIGNREGGIWTDLAGTVPAAPVDLSRPGVAQYRGPDGEIRLGAVSLVAQTPWAAWVEFPRAGIIAPARSFLNQIVPAALLLVVLGAGVAAVVSARITTPLATVSAAAHAIASGDYSQRVATHRRDEIGRLGHAFNEMAERVQDAQQQLEARVAARTAELDTARQAADRANRAKSEFLSRMSHELRTPLNAIMGFAQVLELDPLTEEQRDGVAHILRGGRHLLSLINEVLDVARIEAGALSLSPEPVAVADIVQHAVDLIRPLAAERHLTVTIDPLPQTFALADRQRLNQILFNLLSNAVKYNRERGTVRVFSPAAPPGRVAIVVADTGAGIPPDKLRLLFTPFERLGAEQSKVEGTGLGLALAKGLAQAMTGSLTVESVIDQGSAFRVELPATESPASHPPASRRQPAADNGGVGTILYIEDNLSNVSLMQRLIKRRPGVELLHAVDGRSGVALVRERRPDLVFLDLHLPDAPGEEVLRQIWEDPDTRDTPVAVLSADATPAQRRRLIASGAMTYLTKPFDIAEVLHVIDRTLASKSEE